MYYGHLQKEKEKQNGGIRMDAKTITAIILVVFIVAALVFLRVRNKKK